MKQKKLWIKSLGLVLTLVSPIVLVACGDDAKKEVFYGKFAMAVDQDLSRVHVEIQTTGKGDTSETTAKIDLTLFVQKFIDVNSAAWSSPSDTQPFINKIDFTLINEQAPSVAIENITFSPSLLKDKDQVLDVYKAAFKTVLSGQKTLSELFKLF